MKAKFVSVWDGGYEIETDCDYNPDTKIVSNIEVSEDCETVEHLDREFIRLPDGTELELHDDEYGPSDSRLVV